MDQVATLTAGWEPDTPLDSTLRQPVFAYANRVAWMVRAAGGWISRHLATCIADTGSAFGYDNAAALLQPPAGTNLGAGLGRARSAATTAINRSLPPGLRDRRRRRDRLGRDLAHPPSSATRPGRHDRRRPDRPGPTRLAVLLASDGHDLYRRLGFADLLRFTSGSPINRQEGNRFDD